jgi:ribosomal protein L40E
MNNLNEVSKQSQEKTLIIRERLKFTFNIITCVALYVSFIGIGLYQDNNTYMWIGWVVLSIAYCIYHEREISKHCEEINLSERLVDIEICETCGRTVKMHRNHCRTCGQQHTSKRNIIQRRQK